MPYKILFIIYILLLASCASNPTPIVDANNAAKIRVFYGAGVYMHPEKTCYSSKDPNKIRAYGGLSMMMRKNKKVGMPVTEDIKWSYHEYIIPAEKPLTLQMTYLAETAVGWDRCGPIGATFVPEVGKYYDTEMIFSSRSCSIQVRELVETSLGKALPKKIVTIPAFECK